VPMAPVAMRTRILRNGKRLQLVKAELTVDGETYASALGLRVCLGVCPHDAPVARPMPGHGASTDSPNAFSGSSPLQGWMVEDEAARIGSFAYWASCDADLVQGEAATSVVRAVMACDLVAAVSRNAQGGAAYPGIDLSLYLARVPSGDWILAENDAEPADAGRCLVSSLLSDGDGAFGYAHQTLVYSNAAD